MYRNLATGLVHMQRIQEDERVYKKDTHNAQHERFQELTNDITALLCHFKQLPWLHGNGGTSSCDVTHDDVTPYFCSEAGSRRKRFRRDYVVFQYIRKTLTNIEKTLQLAIIQT